MSVPAWKFEFVREAYGLNLGVGTRVKALGKDGTVTNADNHVHVRLDGEKHAERYHPGDIEVVA